MDVFAAESCAWKIKSFGEDIAGDAHIMARDTRLADVPHLRRRALEIRKLAAATEKAAAEYLAALEPENVG